MDIAAVVDAFRLGEPLGALEPLGNGPVFTAWKLETSGGRFLVKRVREDKPDWWPPYAKRAMAFERSALGAGINMPRPVEPAHPLVDYLADIDDGGPVRVYEWIDSRPLGRDDDVAEWLGRTLATLTAIGPAIAPGDPLAKLDREDYGVRSLGEWRSWFEEAKTLGLPIGELGLANLEGIQSATEFAAEALDRHEDRVVTHKDVEPWNLLISETGPILVDFDWIGGESAWLVAAWAAVAYGMHEREQPDARRTKAVLRSYVEHGGRLGTQGPLALGRRVGLRLTRLAFNVWTACGHRTKDERVRAEALRLATEKIPTFPSLLSDVARWSEQLVVVDD